MIFQEYAPLARVTLKVLPLHQHVIHMALGVVGELGELIDATKKVAIYGKEWDKTNLTEEVGDVAWYIANYCDDMQVHPGILQTAFDSGFIDGFKQRDKISSALDIGGNLLVLALAANAACLQLTTAKPGEADAVQAVAGLANILGVFCSMVDVDISEALEKNIAKLKARYGDKFSEHSALNRDLGAERVVLEGGDLKTNLSQLHAVAVETAIENGATAEEVAAAALDSDNHLNTANPSATLFLVTSKPVPDAVVALDDTPLAGGSCKVDEPCDGCQ
jgi:hypothetical protein